MSIRLLIAEDQRLLRQCFAHLLSSDPELEVVCTAGDGEEAVAQALNCKPDVALLDLEMPKLDGLKVASVIRERLPGAKVLILSAHDAPIHVRSAVVTGVDGYVLKDVPPDDLVRIVKAVYRGEEIRSPYLADELLLSEQRSMEADFTPRELRMLALLVEGKSNVEMAEELFVSEQTVKRDMMAVFQKLGTENRTQAAVKVLELGLARGKPLGPRETPPGAAEG